MEPRTCDSCAWCQPNEDGEYTMLEFENPQNPEQHAIVSFYGGIFAVELNLDSAANMGGKNLWTLP